METNINSEQMEDKKIIPPNEFFDRLSKITEMSSASAETDTDSKKIEDEDVDEEIAKDEEKAIELYERAIQTNDDDIRKRLSVEIRTNDLRRQYLLRKYELEARKRSEELGTRNRNEESNDPRSEH